MKKRFLIYLGVLIVGLILLFIFNPPYINYPNNCLDAGVQTFRDEECCYGLKKQSKNHWDPGVISPSICVPWYK